MGESVERQGAAAARFFERVLETGNLAAGLIVAFMTLGISLDVVLRYFFNSPISWMKEIVEFAIIWMTFLAAGWVLRQDGHVKMEILHRYVSPTRRELLRTAAALLGVLICLIIVFYTAETTFKYYLSGRTIASERRFLLWPVSRSIPLGMSLVLVQCCRNAVRHWGEHNKLKAGNGRT